MVCRSGTALRHRIHRETSRRNVVRRGEHALDRDVLDADLVIVIVGVKDESLHARFLAQFGPEFEPRRVDQTA